MFWLMPTARTTCSPSPTCWRSLSGTSRRLRQRSSSTVCWSASKTRMGDRRMPGDMKQDIAKLYDAESGDYHQMYQRENLEKPGRYPANYFRLQILVQRLASSNAKRVYEVGVGEGTPLLTMAKMGFDVAGCDISQEMVTAARKNFKAQGLDEHLIQWG